MCFAGRGLWRKHPVVTEARVDLDHGLMTAASWTSVGAGETVRTFAAADVCALGGVAAPRWMCVRRPLEGYESTIALRAQATQVPLEAALFEPAGLRDAGAALQASAEELALCG